MTDELLDHLRAAGFDPIIFDEETVWGVWCEVWGGVTGHRESWLKEDGKEWNGSFEQADQKARELNQSMNNARSRANFRYTPRIVR